MERNERSEAVAKTIHPQILWGASLGRIAMVATAIGLGGAALLGVIGLHVSGPLPAHAAVTSVASITDSEVSSDTSTHETEVTTQLITTQGNATASPPSKPSARPRGRRTAAGLQSS
jgi:hypothetical protein